MKKCFSTNGVLENELVSPHFGSYKESKLRGKRRSAGSGRYSAVKSSQLSWAGRYRKCVQYDFKFTTKYSGMYEFMKTVFENVLFKGVPNNMRLKYIYI